MNTSQELRPCILQAREQRRCIIATDNADTHVLTRLYRSGQLLRPHRGVYAEPEIWNALDPQQRSVALSKALALQHPDWVFAGISAATIQGLPHRNWLHHNGQIYVAAGTESPTNSSRQIQHICMKRNAYVVTDLLRTTPLARTLVDCGMRYRFRDALVMYDYALCKKLVTRNAITDIMDALPRIKEGAFHRIHALLKYMSPLSESVGESLCRGTMLEAGFPDPRQQVVHLDQSDVSNTYRTDFEFTAADGGTVIVEFDGAQKYTDPSMTGNRAIRAVIHREQNRERALANEPGIKQVIRFDYDQVMHFEPVVQALVAAGVPRNAAPTPFAN